MSIDQHGRYATMLIRRADRNAPNATFSKLSDGSLRVARKEEDEGGDTAAHMILSLRASRPGACLCIIEIAPGLSHRVVQALLNELIRQKCKGQGEESGGRKKPVVFAYSHPSGAKRRETPFQPHIELRGHLAEDLARDIDDGQLRQIELVKDRRSNPIGGDRYLLETEYKLIVKPKQDIPPQQKLQRLIRAFSSCRNDFDKARITFKDSNSRTHTVDINLESGTPEQQLYVRSTLIQNINPPLDQSCDKIQPHFAQKIAEIMISEYTEAHE